MQPRGVPRPILEVLWRGSPTYTPVGRWPNCPARFSLGRGSDAEPTRHSSRLSWVWMFKLDQPLLTQGTGRIESGDGGVEVNQRVGGAPVLSAGSPHVRVCPDAGTRLVVPRWTPSVPRCGDTRASLCHVSHDSSPSSRKASESSAWLFLDSAPLWHLLSFLCRPPRSQPHCSWQAPNWPRAPRPPLRTEI